jgi:uncharacterized protein
MHCPKCTAEMELVGIGDIEIDRCTRCRGIWFDRQEHRELKEARGVHKADIGHRAIGEHYNDVRDILCPRCHIAMDKAEQRRGRARISYEICPGCHGSFFDAGEVRTLADLTLPEFAREMVARIMKKISRGG